MPRNPPKWPFPNWTYLGLSRDTPPWSTPSKDTGVSAARMARLKPSHLLDLVRLSQQVVSNNDMALDDVNRRNFSNEVRGDLNNGNFDNIVAHFNPSFEVSRGTTITISDDVLDPGKHSAITFKDSAHKKGKDSSAKSPRVNFGEGVSVSRERPRGGVGLKLPVILEYPWPNPWKKFISNPNFSKESISGSKDEALVNDEDIVSRQ
ncbi:hypothetical protein F383_08422 [Gossypium arboreum]|uniref:Uncharacterized protein n=2 Tax=Gossypium arboreum TaxID=29729 RepID=A0A0B0MU83_GOSAR|nr:hypothetical protein F383_08422 [Gossypium arboreum]